MDRGKRVPSPPDTPDVALSLARIGWPVFPVWITEDESSKRHKKPAIRWKDGATTDPDTIRGWWSGRFSDCWIGVYTGAAGLVILDVDPGGDDSIREAGYQIPETFSYPTHRPGARHHIYAAPEGIDLTVAAGILPGVDVRAGAGLMVYYGPELTEPPTLAPTPNWLIVARDRPAGTEVAPNATVTAYLERLSDGKPDEAVRDALAAVTREGMDHPAMLEAVTELVRLGSDGHPGVSFALDAARDVYSSGWPDADRAWDAAVAGSVRRFGLPRRTIPLSKQERKAIRRRNTPEAVEASSAARKRAFRATKHASAIQVAKDSHKRPEAGERVLEDAPLADELSHLFRGTWSYSRGMGLMHWDGVVWKPAEEISLVEKVRAELFEVEIAEHTAAALRGDGKAITKARSLLSRTRAVAVARFIVGILAEDEPEYDSHPDLLNTPSGVVDLHTGELRPHDPSLYFTKVTGVGYDPAADTSMWEKALEALPEKVRPWLQMRFGQAATGYTPEDDVMLIFEGAGENGKSAITIALRRALGDYATTLPDRLLLGDPGDHPTTLMNLYGARLGIIEELPEGRSLNVKRLKDAIGTPEITARRMRQDDITFRTTHALVVNTNYLPIVAETDHGTWRRLALVRFPLTFTKSKEQIRSRRHRLGDPEVKRHFERVADAGVLRWLVEGAMRWYANGSRFPAPPKIVADDTEAWRMEADPVLAYTAERIVRDEGYAITAADLADDFNQWLERRGHRRWTQQTINSRFAGHVSFDGVERRKVQWSATMRPSRPSVFSVGQPPGVTPSWAGIRFADEDRVPSEADRDAATIADLNRRASA